LLCAHDELRTLDLKLLRALLDALSSLGLFADQLKLLGLRGESLGLALDLEFLAVAEFLQDSN